MGVSKKSERKKTNLPPKSTGLFTRRQTRTPPGLQTPHPRHHLHFPLRYHRHHHQPVSFVGVYCKQTQDKQQPPI